MKTLFAVALLLALSTTLMADTTSGALVVSVCGNQAFKAGEVQRWTMDTSGQLCQ